MKLFNSYKKGVNLGGWLSQFQSDKANHYNSFIVREDIMRIAGWGADHVRLPVDFEIIQEDSNPYAMKEEGLRYIDNCIKWCQEMKLNVVLDLHKGPGQIYGYDETPNPILSEEENINRYKKIWVALAERYKSINDQLVFELLNEITDGTGYLWNVFCKNAISAIREVDKTRTIIVGSNDANSIFMLKDLEIIEDENVVYNFHYYDPLVFTHQRAHFSQDMVEYNHQILYPGEINDLGYFCENKPHYKERLWRYIGEKNNFELMCKYFENAVNFLKYNKKQLYCGEFGVINNTPSESAARWIRDVTQLLDKYEIGHAYWTYKEMDFGLVTINGEVVDEKLMKQLFPSKK